MIINDDGCIASASAPSFHLFCSLSFLHTQGANCSKFNSEFNSTTLSLRIQLQPAVRNLQMAIVQGTMLYAAELTWNGGVGIEGEC